jgi:geranylgeranyl reductase family protein
MSDVTSDAIDKATYDAIVVGAGPGGSVAAAVLARQGIHTLLLDRDHFPREKACGDAVQSEGLALLRDIGLDAPFPEDFFAVDRAALIGPSGQRALFTMYPTADEPCRIVTRYTFDHLLYQFAIACGAEARQASVTAPIVQQGRVVGVRVKAGKADVTYRARLVIGADGATSVIARGLGVPARAERDRGVSLRGYVETEVDLEPIIELAFLRDLQPGYAWLFPISKRKANIGIGMRADVYRKLDLPLKHYLDRYLALPHIRAVIGEQPVTGTKSWQLPLCTVRQQRVFDGALLAGDAGGWVDPLLGAGIAPAMFTGKFAAEVGAAALRAGDTSAARLAAYDHRCREHFGGDMQLKAAVQRLLTWLPQALDVLLSASSVAPGLVQRLVMKG